MELDTACPRDASVHGPVTSVPVSEKDPGEQDLTTAETVLRPARAKRRSAEQTRLQESEDETTTEIQPKASALSVHTNIQQ